MPSRPKRPCSFIGCGVLTSSRYCTTHEAQAQARQKEKQQQFDRSRGTATQRGYDSKWRKAREGYLRSHPLCVSCYGEGKLMAATVVDHITPHKGDMALFWDKNNWQGLCASCHSAKTSREESWNNGR